jgi:hypothetical protein
MVVPVVTKTSALVVPAPLVVGVMTMMAAASFVRPAVPRPVPRPP